MIFVEPNIPTLNLLCTRWGQLISIGADSIRCQWTIATTGSIIFDRLEPEPTRITFDEPLDIIDCLISLASSLPFKWNNILLPSVKLEKPIFPRVISF